MSPLFEVYALLNKEPSVIKKYLKVLDTATTVIITVWVFAVIFPLPVWFSEKRVINGHVIYSNNNMDLGLLQNVLDITKEKTKTFTIDAPKSLPPIYLHNNDIVFYLSTLRFPSNTTAVYGAIYNRIHVRLNEKNMYINKVLDQDWLSTVIAHEKIHHLQYERYGIFTYTLFMPKWVSEGYARYVSYDHIPPDVDYDEWLRMVNAGESVNENFESWVLVIHAIDQMGYSIDELHNGEVDREEVEKSLLDWVKNNPQQTIKDAYAFNIYC